ncbi:MAG: WecB/TagA/CpsF family glycosyltransferase [Patescibacteria group bacterium]
MAKILGVRIDNLRNKEILRKIEEFLGESKFHQIATVNPEFILEAQKNQEFCAILNDCDLNVADGFGVRCAFWRNFWHLKYRMAGADLLLEILKIAEKKGRSVFLACRKDGLTSFEEAKENILGKYPRIKIKGANLDLLGVRPLINRGPTPNCEVLICNFGAPNQEFFIKSQKDGKIRLAIGVGGALDFLSGKMKRAPKFMRVLGLEWLWRFIQEPKYRFSRIFRAVIIFPIRVIFNK